MAVGVGIATFFHCLLFFQRTAIFLFPPTLFPPDQMARSPLLVSEVAGSLFPFFLFMTLSPQPPFFTESRRFFPFLLSTGRSFRRNRQFPQQVERIKTPFFSPLRLFSWPSSFFIIFVGVVDIPLSPLNPAKAGCLLPTTAGGEGFGSPSLSRSRSDC